MAQIIHIATGDVIEVAAQPVWVAGTWECGDRRFTDADLSEYEAVAVAPSRLVTRLAFRNRFTQAEKVTLEIASLDNPAATMAERQQAAALRASMKDQENATFIDLDRADTRTGVQTLEAGGLLAAGRAAAILDAEVQPQEVFHG